ncbi:MAG: hypothetical protein AAGA60_24935 [Cyanobacteria bacterium P01_E01_bin.42]
MAHRKHCQEEIYQAIHNLTHQEQIQYYQALVAKSSLEQWRHSLQDETNKA